jgi:hypothetical protein
VLATVLICETINDHISARILVWQHRRLSAVQPLNQRLGAPQPDGRPSLLRVLLTRACSLPMIFEHPDSARRLTLFVYETRLACTPYFVNFAAALEALDGPRFYQPSSPVLAGSTSLFLMNISYVYLFVSHTPSPCRAQVFSHPNLVEWISSDVSFVRSFVRSFVCLFVCLFRTHQAPVLHNCAADTIYALEESICSDV